jgi:hypothetical protein
MYASEGHKFIVDRVLKVNEGLTHDLFKENEVLEEANEENEVKEMSEEEIAKSKLPKYLFVKEVVREPRMHFF